MASKVLFLLAVLYSVSSIDCALAAPEPGVIDQALITTDRYDSPLHFRPKVGSVGDTIPFFWKGQYHIFYLRAGFYHQPWEHIFSTDLIHWYELTSALVPDGAVDGPDGMTIGTGSIFEHNGIFHLYYTGDNFRNPKGVQCVMRATSTDLVNWTKHPEDALYAAGDIYKNDGFRDPYVIWNDDAKAFWMIVCAFDAKTGKPLQGVAQSDDLIAWKQSEPLAYDPVPDANSECPDLFKMGDTWYMVHSMWYPSSSTGATFVRYSKSIRGPYRFSPVPEIDTTILYAAKSMFDGKRRVITGWIRDLGGNRDDGKPLFGGDQCVPREVNAGPNGQLFFRPVPEAAAQFNHVAFRSIQHPDLNALSSSIATPENYMLECTVQLDPGAEFAVTMRQSDTPNKDGNTGYRLILHSGRREGEIAGSNFSYSRKVDIDFTKPVKIQAFVQGSIIECFIQDAYAFSCRAYEHPSGNLKMSVENGRAQVINVSVKTHESPR